MKLLPNTFADNLQSALWMHIAWMLLVSCGLHLGAVAGGHVVFGEALVTFSLISLPVWFICVAPEFIDSRLGPTLQGMLVGGYALILGVALLISGLSFFPLSLKQVGGEPTALSIAIGCLLGGHVLISLVKSRQTSARTQSELLPWWKSKIGKILLGIGLFSLAIVLVLSSNSIQENYLPVQSSREVFIILGISLQVIVAYVCYYGLYCWHHDVLFQRVLQHQGIFAYLLGGLTSVVIFTALHGGLLHLLSDVVTHKLHPVAVVERSFSETVLGFNIVAFLIPLPYILVVEWFRRERTLTRVEAEKTSTELALLREQINPHFFFNTLNNLYAMSLSGEERTPDTILQLADLMRYVIYRGKEDAVSLGEEVDYLRDYLNLQSIRFAHRLDLNFSVDKAVDLDQQVAPLLFVVIVENAFKHGIEQAEEASYLSIKLEMSDSGWLQFSCKNSVAPDPENLQLEATTQTDWQRTSGGLGLVNLRRRLNLRYPQKHDLKLSHIQNRYQAVLMLNLIDQ